MTRLVGIAGRAHRRGLMSLEAELDGIDHPLLRDGLTLIVDGASIETLRDIVAAERRARDADEEAPARVFEAAAGYAPTLGILGAVLGLIEVMKHLSEPSALGSGIAVAFVATVFVHGTKFHCTTCGRDLGGHVMRNDRFGSDRLVRFCPYCGTGIDDGSP